MKIPLLDLKAHHDPIRQELMEAIGRVVESGRFILGPEVRELETSVAAVSGAKHGIGVSSGSDALLIVLMAWGIGPGDEVIVPDYSFFATAGAVSRLGAKPVFVDIDPATYNLDPARIEPALTDRTKAVIPVHLYGQVADMKPILELCRKKGLKVLEDAAQSIGAAPVTGDAAALSFFPTKNLGGLGDGGMVVTHDDALAERLRVLRVHGSKPKYYHSVIGGNFRLDTILAAALNVKMKYREKWTEERRRNAGRYDALFEGKLPTPARVFPHVFNQYVVRVPNRDKVREAMAADGVATEIYYPVPFHAQECFAGLGGSDETLPHSTLAARETLALPIYPELTEAQQARVAEVLLSHI